MREGLLWFDNTPNRAIGDKIKQAVERYQVRLQRQPTVCYVNASQLGADQTEINGIAVRPAAYIRPHYFWLGVEAEARPGQAA